MCIRDSYDVAQHCGAQDFPIFLGGDHAMAIGTISGMAAQGCLLYTSDAADERSSVDLGGRRIIKKQNEL